jgi:hypothetical protein
MVENLPAETHRAGIVGKALQPREKIKTGQPRLEGLEDSAF